MVTIPTGTWVDGNVDAGELRKSLGAALIVPGGPVAPRPGRLAGPGTPLTVSPTAPASMAVLVKAGKAHTYRSAAYGPVLGIGPDGDVTLPIVAPASGSQWYRVYLNQRDSSPPANDADSLAVVDVIAGNPATTPAKPALPAGALLLGEVLVPAGASSITAAMVTDLPTWTAPRGGILPITNQAERVALQTAGLVWPSLEVLELDTGRRLWHDGTRFRYLGDRLEVTNVAARDQLTPYAGLRVQTIAGTAGAPQADAQVPNGYRHDGTSWVPDDTGFLQAAAITGIVVGASWTVTDLYFARRHGQLFVNGLAGRPSWVNGEVIVTLPVGWRPLRETEYLARIGATYYTATINTAGQLRIFIDNAGGTLTGNSVDTFAVIGTPTALA